ncbi:MAG: hypothetical protein ABJE00_06025 [Erythrobacter sp.]
MVPSAEDFLENDCKMIRHINPNFEDEFATKGRCWIPALFRENISAVRAALARHFDVPDLEARAVPPDWEVVFVDNSHSSNDGHQVEETAQLRSLWIQDKSG